MIFKKSLEIKRTLKNTSKCKLLHESPSGKLVRTQCVFKSVKSFIKQECDLDNVNMFKKFFSHKGYE